MQVFMRILTFKLLLFE